MLEQIKRESGGIKYVGSCSSGLFRPGLMFCLACGGEVKVYPEGHAKGISLTCSKCQKQIHSFQNDAEQHRFLSKEWTVLDQVCKDRTATIGHPD
jgi:hypothetical protein